MFRTMAWRSLIRVYRCVIGVLAIVAVAVQLADLAGRGTLRPVNFFSYFTVESNVFGAVVLLLAAWRPSAVHSAILDFVRGGIVVYLTVTGLVFAVLLSGTDVDATIPWVNTLLHQLMPLLAVIDWVLVPPSTALTIRRGLLWLGYPLVWLAYTLGRGALVHWYPYPFVDPSGVGYAMVAIYAAVILGVIACVCVLTVVLGNAARALWRSARW
jgi:hypothetical protein